MSTCHLCFVPPVMSVACLFSLLLLLSANPCLSACCRHRRRRLLTRLGLGRSVLCSGSPRGSGGGEAGGGRCRLTFTPGERWELWEQSVLVCWRRPACSVLHAWVWARGTEGVGLRICQRREGKKLKISAAEDTRWTSRANDREKAVVCVLVASSLCPLVSSEIRFCLKVFCVNADTINHLCCLMNPMVILLLF